MTQANTNTTSVLFYVIFCLREEVILLHFNPVKTEGDGKGERALESTRQRLKNVDKR